MNQNPTGRTTIGPRRCSRKFCGHLATCIPVLRVPAKGCPSAEHEPLIIEIPLPLCEGHFQAADKGEFRSKQLKQTVKALCSQTGRAQPDFSRAYLERKLLK